MNAKHLRTRKQAEYCLEMMRRINENIKVRTARMNDDSYEYIGHMMKLQEPASKVR